jgi:hypothetical protein
LRHLDGITNDYLVAMKRNRATEIAYSRVLIDFRPEELMQHLDENDDLQYRGLLNM